MDNPKCENCGKELEDSLSTHCSDECLFDSIKNSRPFGVNEMEDNSTSNNYE